MEKETQAARNVMMIQPVRFGFNQETAIDNDFQHKSDLKPEEIQLKARDEFNRYVLKLASKGIHVVAFEDTYVPFTPDSIFCNNWVSFHADGTVILYPMEAEDRRGERRKDILEQLESTYHFQIKRTIDITTEEESGRFLESTGSMVFDYVNKIIYACLSPRTNKDLLYLVAKKLGYDKVYTFESADEKGEEIYHTNVMMCVGEKFAMIWADSIKNPRDRDAVINSLTETGHEIIYLNSDQIDHFAGNALEVANVKDERFLIISQEGADSLREDQKKTLSKYVEIVPITLDIIEQSNGGSARCMLADIRLPKNTDFQPSAS